MVVHPRRFDARTQSLPFLLASALLHAFALFAGHSLEAAPLVEFEVPDHVEFGLVDTDPGASGAPPPAVAPAPPPPPVEPVQPIAAQDDSLSDIVVDGGVAELAPDASAPPDTAAPDLVAQVAATDAGAVDAPRARSGDGSSPSGFGEGLGFGTGGFGTGSGGPLGAIIALHADLDRIRKTSLILETEALLDVIPEWQQLLQGSGLDARNDFSRVFVATPSLRRSNVVVSARLRGGEAALEQAALRLSQERGCPASARIDNGVKLWPWHDRGPTERVAGLFSADQIVIARPDDVGRVLAVSSSLARRHAAERGMERADGPAALLSMYEGEAVALSVEGVGQFLAGDVAHAPVGLRISLRHLDEYHAKLRALGYYRSEQEAIAAFERIETLRAGFADHPRAAYLGLRSAIAEAVFERDGSTVTVDALLTLHQTRYLLGFVSRALAPKD